MKNDLNYFDIVKAKQAYREGKNVIDLLKAQQKSPISTSEIIEVSYDLQAGSYIEYVKQNVSKVSLYTSELVQILDKHITPSGNLMDIGTGELTTLSMVLKNIKQKPRAVYAMDISWSRVYKGICYAKNNLGQEYDTLRPFVADMAEIPMLDKSINITTSSHALEPNGGKLPELMRELFRITIDKLILFEPCYEINTQEGKNRMDKLGYIKNIYEVIKNLGGELLEEIVIKNPVNPLNPTVCFVIKPPPLNEKSSIPSIPTNNIFSVPGSNMPLDQFENFYYSKKTGLCYPILKTIPVLKSSCAILATAFLDFCENEEIF